MTRSTQPTNGKYPIQNIARLTLAAAVTCLGLGISAQSAEASSILEGKSRGMTKCVRAILGGYEVKKVNVHGHHFNCKPMLSSNNSRGSFRHVYLSHSQRGIDDQVWINFEVNSLNVIVPNTAKFQIYRGLSVKSLDRLRFKFKGPSNPPAIADYAFFAKRAREMRPVEVDNWQQVARQIMAVVIAEVGNPENRGTAPRQVDCSLPTFYEHDNFRGRSYRLGGSQPNFHKVIVGGKHMGDVISSMCLPRGWRVTVYMLPNYQGPSYDFAGPGEYADLQRQPVGNGRRLAWGDKISSVRVTRR